MSYDLTSPAHTTYPYDTYTQLLSNDPVYWSEKTRHWYISRYQDVCDVLRNTRFSSNRVKAMTTRLPAPLREFLSPLIDSLSRWVLFHDPPHHQKIRRVLNHALTARVIEEMQPSIESLIDELLDEIDPSEPFDVIQSLAYPLPAIVIAEMLGVPPEDRDTFKQWSDQIAQFLGSTIDPAKVPELQASIQEATDYFREILHAYRKQPKDNLMGELRKVQAQHPDFDDESLLANCIALIFAGHETTTHLIANGLNALLTHPESLTQVKAQPSLFDAAVEECLRYDGPIQRLSRVAAEDITLNGHTIPAKDRVILLLGAAHRDPAQYQDPDTFSLARQKSRNLGFGYGPHLCSGAALGRLEARLALSTLLRAFPNLQPTTQTRSWQHILGLRAMDSFLLQA